jgi:hypothetical protein
MSINNDDDNEDQGNNYDLDDGYGNNDGGDDDNNDDDDHDDDDGDDENDDDDGDGNNDEIGDDINDEGDDSDEEGSQENDDDENIAVVAETSGSYSKRRKLNTLSYDLSKKPDIEALLKKGFGKIANRKLMVLAVLDLIHTSFANSPSRTIPTLIEFSRIESILGLYIKYGYSNCVFAKKLYSSFKTFKSKASKNKTTETEEKFTSSVIKKWTSSCKEELL